MKIRTRPAARHDAEWLLHYANVTNDIQTGKQRRAAEHNAATRPANQSSGRVQLRLARRRPGTTLHVQLVLAGYAAERGATTQELSEVLDIVGILPSSELSSTFNDKGERRRLVAPCPDCGRPHIQLRTDMRFVSHPRESGQPINDETRCPGGGTMSDRATRTAPPEPKPEPRAAVQAVRPAGPPVLPGRRAACQDASPELFYPPTYGDAHAEQVRKAKRVCRQCPLIADCLRYALEHDELTYGIWGGTTPIQRKALARKDAA